VSKTLMASSFWPEFRWSGRLCQVAPSDRRTEAIHAAGGGLLDWQRFLRVARRHGVIGLVHDGLTRARPDVSSEIAREIGVQAATLVYDNLAMAGEACGYSACSTMPICRPCSSKVPRLPCSPSSGAHNRSHYTM
jgi:hypothetical protein